MTALAKQALIANATEAAHNPFASAHTNQAVAQLLAFLIENKAPGFGGHGGSFTVGMFEGADNYLKQLAPLADDVVFNIARDGDVKTSRTIFSDALHDNGPDFAGASERVLEDA